MVSGAVGPVKWIGTFDAMAQRQQQQLNSIQIADTHTEMPNEMKNYDWHGWRWPSLRSSVSAFIAENSFPLQIARTFFVTLSFSSSPPFLWRFLKLHNALSVYAGQPHRTRNKRRKKSTFGMRIMEHVTASQTVSSSYCPSASWTERSIRNSHFRLNCFHVLPVCMHIFVSSWVLRKWELCGRGCVFRPNSKPRLFFFPLVCESVCT